MSRAVGHPGSGPSPETIEANVGYPENKSVGKNGMAFRINGAYLQLFQMNRNAPDGKHDQLVGSVFSGTGFSDEASQMIHASLVS